MVGDLHGDGYIYSGEEDGLDRGSGQVQFSLHLCCLDLADQCQLFPKRWLAYVTNMAK